MFLIPTTDPGWSCTPVHTLGGVRTNATYYDNVRVTRQNLVGELNGGWKLITGQLNRERLSLMNYGFTAVLLNTVTQWVIDTQLADAIKVFHVAHQPGLNPDDPLGDDPGGTPVLKPGMPIPECDGLPDFDHA